MSARTAPSPRSTSRLERASRRSRVAALAGVLAATAALSACGSDDGAPAPAATPTPAATSPSGSATPPTWTAVTRDPAAPVPAAAFFAGVAEAWTIPGAPMQDTAGSVSADRSMIGMRGQAGGASLQVFGLGAAASAPLWEGECATAHWWGNRLVCGGDVVDPRSGASATVPAGTYAGSTAETLVLRDGDTWVAYDTALAEVWRSEIAGDGMVYGFPDLPVAMALDMTTFAFATVDVRTGEVRPTAMTVLAADGYLEAADAAGPLVARDFSGAERGQVPLTVPECIPPYGERPVLADRLSCPAGYDGDPATLTGFLLRADGAPKLLEFVDASTFAVDGETFAVGDRGFVMAWLFGDEQHFLVRFDAGFGLYASGSPDPVVEIGADDLLVAAPDLLVAFGDGDGIGEGDGGATVLVPAG